MEDGQLLVTYANCGKVDYAIWASHLLQKIPSIRHLVCIGTAGSLHPQIHPPGSLVAARSVIEHDYTEQFDSARKPEFYCNKQFLELLLSLSIASTTLLSGDEDIVDSQRAKDLHLAHAAGAVAWEGAGGARAARFYKVAYNELRVITDSADSSASTDFKENIHRCMNSLAETLNPLLSGNSDLFIEPVAETGKS